MENIYLLKIGMKIYKIATTITTLTVSWRSLKGIVGEEKIILKI